MGTHRRVHPPHRRHFVRFLTRHDSHQRIALFGVRALVDDELHRAVAEVNRTRPLVNRRAAQAVKLHVAKMPRLDLIAHRSFAPAVRWQPVELAGTAVRTIAIAEFLALNRPFDGWHC